MATKKPSTKSGKRSKVHKVMDEYKQGALKSGPKGKGGKVKSRKQAIAIALSESGQSKRKKSASKKSSASRKKSASKSRTSSKKKSASR